MSYGSDPSERNARFGRRIRARRLELGLTQTALARSVEIEQSSLSHIEAGRAGISDDVKERIADALKTTVRELFWEQPEGARS
jgi:transcriptional regulator with XRE-family HTH domain